MGSVAEAVEYLFCKHEGLSSNPSPTNNYNNNIIIKEVGYLAQVIELQAPDYQDRGPEFKL
jgi:hypothetical protein